MKNYFWIISVGLSLLLLKTCFASIIGKYQRCHHYCATITIKPDSTFIYHRVFDMFGDQEGTGKITKIGENLYSANSFKQKPNPLPVKKYETGKDFITVHIINENDVHIPNASLKITSADTIYKGYSDKKGNFAVPKNEIKNIEIYFPAYNSINESVHFDKNIDSLVFKLVPLDISYVYIINDQWLIKNDTLYVQFSNGKWDINFPFIKIIK